jgi:hypothetical protein
MVTKPKKTTKIPRLIAQSPGDLTLTEAKALVKFAKEQGIKKLSYNGLVMEFGLMEPEVLMSDSFDYSLDGRSLSLEDNENNEDDEATRAEKKHKNMKIEVQELLRDINEQNKPKVEIDETDMWGV